MGQQVGERTIEKVSDDLARIEPPMSPTIERIAVKEDREVVVSVNRGAARPYQCRGNGRTPADVFTVPLAAAGL